MTLEEIVAEIRTSEGLGKALNGQIHKADIDGVKLSEAWGRVSQEYGKFFDLLCEEMRKQQVSWF